jgi:transposase
MYSLMRNYQNKRYFNRFCNPIRSDHPPSDPLDTPSPPPTAPARARPARRIFENPHPNDRAAYKLLARHAFPNRQRTCPRCNGRKLYPLASGRKRCSRCRHTFAEFSGRYLSRASLPPHAWLELLHHFAHGRSTAETARYLKLSFHTTDHALQILRFALRQIPPQMTPRRPHTIFGLAWRDAALVVEPLPHLSPHDLLDIPRVLRAGTVYTAPFRPPGHPLFDTLVFAPPRRYPAYPDPSSPLAIDHLSGFWNYAHHYRLTFQRISPARLESFWHEHAFRHRHPVPIPLPALLGPLCSLIPPVAQ